MPFQAGKTKTGGRRVGVSNRLTGAFREAVLHVYSGLGGHAAFLEWARQNPSEYYKIAARLIPVELRHEEDRTINVIINREPCDDRPRGIPLMVEDRTIVKAEPLDR